MKKLFFSQDRRLKSQQLIHDGLNSIFGRDTEVLPVAKDLGRLVRRIIVKKNENIIFQVEESSAESTIILVGEVLHVLLTELEEADQAKISQSIVENNLINNSKNYGDWELIVQDTIKLLEIQNNSQAVRILKLIHQGIIGFSLYFIKQGILANTKDVRNHDGWKIIIDTSNDAISVTHIRKEQSIEFDGKNHWEMMWSIRMVLDKTLHQVQQAQLQIHEVCLNKSINRPIARKVRRDVRRFESIYSHEKALFTEKHFT